MSSSMSARSSSTSTSNVDYTSDEEERGESEKVRLAKKIGRFVIIHEVKGMIDQLDKMAPLSEEDKEKVASCLERMRPRAW